METAELKVVKRDDSVEDFDIKKIERAIARACQETHDAEGEKNASIVAEKALDEFSGKIKK
jgi:transcriptional regulator NrdR family protein